MNSKKSNRKQILLSVLALLVILLVGAGITYSWIEGGTTYTIMTEKSGDVKTGINPYSGTGVKKSIKLDPSVSNSITLASYDHNTNKDQKLYFSPVLSANGTDFFFPTAFDANKNPTSYRKANTNDIGTKFINYKFDVKAEKKCYLAFNGAPKITATKSNTTVSGTSAFRIMLRSGDERVVFTTGTSEMNTSVVTDVNGTKGTLTAKPVSNYLYTVNGNTKIFEYEAGEEAEMEVSVWLDGNTASDELIGSDISLDMQLIVAQEKVKITLDAVTYSNTGTRLTNGFTGGKIDGNSNKTVNYYNIGSTFTATASTNPNYEFNGWYTDEACTNRVSQSNLLSTTASQEATYYAKFTEKPKYTINVSSVTSPSGTGGTVTVNGSGMSYTGYKDSTTSILATPSSGYQFIGWYTNSSCTGSAYSTSKNPVVTITGHQTYYAKFVKTCTVTFISVTDNNVNNHNGGKVQIDSGSLNTTVTKTVTYNTQVQLTATANQGYVFKGIKLSTGTTTWKTLPLTQTITANVTYYAYFETQPESTTTIYFESRNYAKHCAYVYNSSDTSIKYSAGWSDGVAGGSVLSLDSATGYYKFTFTTTDVGNFRVIINDSGNSQIQYPATNLEGLEGTIGKTYLFKAGSPTALVEFDPNLKYTLTVVPVGTGGSATVNNTSSSTATVYPGTTVNIKATPSSGYEFVGWYTNSACTGTAYSTSASVDVTVNSTITYYAKFEKNSTITVYFTNNKNWSSVYCYYWGGSSSTNWPGSAMTYDKTNSYGEKIYKITIPADTTGIIFDSGNGGAQTVDITSNILDGKGFYLSSQQGDGKWTVGVYDYS